MSIRLNDFHPSLSDAFENEGNEITLIHLVSERQSALNTFSKQRSDLD